MRGLGFCWFDGLYARVVPSHAVELTARLLDRGVAATLKRQRIASATLQHKQDLAAVIHLCGAGAGEILRQARLPIDPRAAMRRSRRARLSRARQRHEAAVCPAGERLLIPSAAASRIRSYGGLLGHRPTKAVATDIPKLLPPRNISTLPK